MDVAKFQPSEDTKTSSTLGVLQYLPDEMFWNIMCKACRDHSFPIFSEVGAIIDFHFWDKLNAQDTGNKISVELDVWIETENYRIIIEAKKDDGRGQYENQWKKEIKALANEYGRDKKFILIALGGNKSLESLSDKNIGTCVFKITWYELLHAVVEQLPSSKSRANQRILQDVIDGFAAHKVVDVQWLDSWCYGRIESSYRELYWKPEFLSNLYHKTILKRTIAWNRMN